MERTVLVSDADTPAGRELVRLLGARGLRVVAAACAGAPVELRGAVVVPWNPPSPASARQLVLSTINRFGSLETGIVLCAPVVDAAGAREIASAAVSQGLDRYLKGPILLARALLDHFAAAGSGTLALALYSPKREEEQVPPMERALREGFRGFASGVLSAPAEKSVVVNGLLCLGATAEEFAAFVDQSLDEKARKVSGRWLSPPGRGGILGRR